MHDALICRIVWLRYGSSNAISPAFCLKLGRIKRGSRKQCCKGKLGNSCSEKNSLQKWRHCVNQHDVNRNATLIWRTDSRNPAKVWESAAQVTTCIIIMTPGTSLIYIFQDLGDHREVARPLGGRMAERYSGNERWTMPMLIPTGVSCAKDQHASWFWRFCAWPYSQV